MSDKPTCRTVPNISSLLISYRYHEPACLGSIPEYGGHMQVAYFYSHEKYHIWINQTFSLTSDPNYLVYVL